MSKTLRERLDEAITKLKAYADLLDKSEQVPSGEQQAQLIEHMDEVKSLSAAIKSQMEVNEQITDTTKFVTSLAEVGDNVIKSLADVAPSQLPTGGLKTLGQLFVESQNFDDFRKRYAGRDGVIPSTTKGINMQPFQSNVGAKALITGLSDTSAGAAVTSDRLPTVVDLIGDKELRITDLVTKGSTTSDTVEYMRITGKTNNAAPVPEATSSGTFGDGTGGTATLITGGYKPESAMTFDVVSTTVKTIANWLPITKRAASDAGQVRTLVDAFLRQNVLDTLDAQIAAGDGIGENLLGILATPGILTVGSAGTDLDAIVDAIRTVRVTGRRSPTAMVIHPDDWYSLGFLLAKDTTGQYLVGSPKASIDEIQTLWGLAVVVSDGIPANTALVGDFRQAVLWEREGITVSVTDSHADFFVRNILAILAEMRAAFGVLDPQAFCTVTAI